MAECRLAFSLYTPTLYMRIYTYLFTQLSLQHHAHLPLPTAPLSSTCSLRIFQFVCSSKLLFCAFCQMNFPRRSQELFGICLQLLPLFRWFIRITPYITPHITPLIYIYDIFLSQSTKILISSPTNFVIACCVCREERKCSEFKLDFCAH